MSFENLGAVKRSIEVWALEIKVADDRWIMRSTFGSEREACLARDRGGYQPGWSRITQREVL